MRIKKEIIENNKRGKGKMAEVNLYNIKGESLGKIQLPSEFFIDRVNKALLHEAVRMYMTNKRNGTACTKNKGEVSGGGAKPWKQKGTGRARAGSNRSPLWRHGGTIFGPKPRNYKYSIPYKKRRIALKGALSVKLKDKEILVLESIETNEPKTRIFSKILDKLNATENCLLLVKNIGDNLKRISRNIAGLKVLEVSAVNAYDVINCKKLIIVREAIESLENLFRVEVNKSLK